MIVVANVAGAQEDYIDRIVDLKKSGKISEAQYREISEKIEAGDFEVVEKLISDIEFAFSEK